MPYNTDDGDGDYDDDVTTMLSFSFEQRFRVCFANDLEYPLEICWFWHWINEERGENRVNTESFKNIQKDIRIEHT